MSDAMNVTNEDLILDPSKPAYIVKQKPMQSFTFKAYDNEYTAQAAVALDIMEDANRQLLWSSKEYKQGTWYARSNNTFVWVEGNFFD